MTVDPTDALQDVVRLVHEPTLTHDYVQVLLDQGRELDELHPELPDLNSVYVPEDGVNVSADPVYGRWIPHGGNPAMGIGPVSLGAIGLVPHVPIIERIYHEEGAHVVEALARDTCRLHAGDRSREELYDRLLVNTEPDLDTTDRIELEQTLTPLVKLLWRYDPAIPEDWAEEADVDVTTHESLPYDNEMFPVNDEED